MISEEDKETIEIIKKEPTYRERALLRTIEKQDKDIEQYKEDLIEHEKTSFEFQEENIKLKKMIDLMAQKIYSLDFNMSHDCFIPREYSDVNDCVKKDSCEQCIKEHFRKLVEDEL